MIIELLSCLMSISQAHMHYMHGRDSTSPQEDAREWNLAPVEITLLSMFIRFTINATNINVQYSKHVQLLMQWSLFSVQFVSSYIQGFNSSPKQKSKQHLRKLSNLRHADIEAYTCQLNVSILGNRAVYYSKDWLDHFHSAPRIRPISKVSHSL